jgi:putative transposase
MQVSQRASSRRFAAGRTAMSAQTINEQYEVRELRCTALIINGTCDHVHMLIRIRPAHSIAEIARIVKTNSSGWVRKKGRKEFAWQAGYGVFSVSESSVPAVKKYIATQDEHHRKGSFQKEFVAFLKKNKVAYDERYIWD